MKNYNLWKNFDWDLPNKLLSRGALYAAVDAFILEMKRSNFKPNDFLNIIFKIKTVNQGFKSISWMQSIRLYEMDQLHEIFHEYLQAKDEEYLIDPTSKIIFVYQILPEYNEHIKKTKIVKSNNNLDNKYKMVFKGFNLPSTMDFETWGEIIERTDNFAMVLKHNSNAVYHIKILENKINVTLKFKDKVIIFFTDTLLEDRDEDRHKLTTFVRQIKNNTYYFLNGKIIFKSQMKNAHFLQRIIKHSFISKRFITMDIETRTIQGVMHCYAISWTDGNIKKSLYLSDYNSPEELLTAAIKQIMLNKYNGFKVYLHNFSFFDGVFFMKVLASLSKSSITPLIKDGKIIDLKFTWKAENVKYHNCLFFRDSFLMLPASLRSLTKNFKIDSQKGIFPFSFVNDINIPLNYVGPVPDFKHFEGISLEEYNKYCYEFNNVWDLQKEVLKYCLIDVVALHKVLNIFQKIIFSSFRLDPLRFVTLSSLAFGIFRCSFLPEIKEAGIYIPLIDGSIYNFIKRGYTGGRVDVFKPQPEINEKVFRYDVNSLYPFAMLKPMPTGYPTFFEGDIYSLYNLINTNNSNFSLFALPGEVTGEVPGEGKKPYGFFEAEVTTPNNMHIPFLQTKLKIQGQGTRTVAPLGSWTDVFYSEELELAMKKGYKVKVLRGYLFKPEIIFDKYVLNLYKRKKNSLKTSANYLIFKLLLNSLYGRFGMSPEMLSHIICDNQQLAGIIADVHIKDILFFDNGKMLVSFFDEPVDFCFDPKGEVQDIEKPPLNISIPIAAAVTANGRIYMNTFLNDATDYTVFYTDTDSIDINKMLDKKYVGDDLGQLKLEHIFNEAIFLAPKVYGGITDNYELTKVKGLKDKLKYEELKDLLYKNQKLLVKQEKWYRNLSLGNITVRDEVYTLINNNNKRILIYDKNNKFIGTEPLKIYKLSTPSYNK